MQGILTFAVVLDIRLDNIAACLVRGSLHTEPEVENRAFSTLMPDMQQLWEWAVETGCRSIAMESTGIYCQPICEILTCFGGKISILVINTRHTKNVPGRKKDMCNAQWIATLPRSGLLKRSFVPDKSFRKLRHLTRYRKSIVHGIAAQKNRIGKFPQSSFSALPRFCRTPSGSQIGTTYAT